MWNPWKITKYSLFMWRDASRHNHYDYEATVDATVALYGEMLFPSNIRTTRKIKRLDDGMALINGEGRFSLEWQEAEYIPLLCDKSYLGSLSPNTVGAHYKTLMTNWSLQELYSRRFENTSKKYKQAGPVVKWISKKLLKGNSDLNEARANMSRHIFLAHDFWHILFRYPTTPLGEACVQAITHQFLEHTGPWYLSHFVALRECWIYKSWGPWKAVREAHKLGSAVPDEFYTLDFKELLESDIEDVRAKYNIGGNSKYWSFAKGKEPRNDVIHPEYRDQIVDGLVASEI